MRMFDAGCGHPTKRADFISPHFSHPTSPPIRPSSNLRLSNHTYVARHLRIFALFSRCVYVPTVQRLRLGGVTFSAPTTNMTASSFVICSDYTPIKKRSRNNWTAMQRVILAWLASYANEWAEIATVFNAFFKAELTSPSGLSTGAITTMFYYMELNPSERATLSLLQSPSTSPNNASFESTTRSSIMKLANGLNITLLEKEPGMGQRTTKSTSSSQMPHRKRKVSVSNSFDFDENENTPHAYPQTPTKQLFGVTHKSYPTPVSPEAPRKLVKISTPSEPALSAIAKKCRTPASKNLAGLGFRAFYPGSHTLFTASGFRAGAFGNTLTRQIPRVPDPESNLFLEHANMHVSKSSNSPSVFISVTKNPMRALHRALHLNAGQQTSVAVIDLREADRGGNVWKVSDLLGYSSAS